jgi:hypothetical protein
MKKLYLVLFALATALAIAPAAVADTPSLQDFAIYTNGTPYYSASTAPGVDLSGYSYGPTGTGLGTITFTDTTLGSDNFAIWWDEEVGVTFYNEYGTAANTGSLLSGESWEIGDNYGSTIYTDATTGSLLNTNYLPLGADNFLASCVAGAVGDCSGDNGDATTALGYGYTVTSGNQEIITLTVSQTAPGSGFYLQQTNPHEGTDNTGPEGDVYFSLSAQQVPAGSGPSPTPEPSSLLLLGTGLLSLAFVAFRRAKASAVTF